MFSWGSGDHCLIRLGESKRHVQVHIDFVCLKVAISRGQEATSSAVSAWHLKEITFLQTARHASQSTYVVDICCMNYFLLLLLQLEPEKDSTALVQLPRRHVSDAVPKGIMLFDCGVKSWTYPSRHGQIDRTDKKKNQMILNGNQN